MANTACDFTEISFDVGKFGSNYFLAKLYYILYLKNNELLVQQNYQQVFDYFEF